MKSLYSKFIVFALLILVFQSCHDMKKRTDLIIYNANIIVNDVVDTTVNCIAIKDGIIELIDDDTYIRSRYWASQYIDAKQAYVYPGFIDAHSHFTGFALSQRYADLSQATSFEQVLDILVDFNKKHPSDWLIGRGWDQNQWSVKQFPDNKRLNELFPYIPVLLTRIDGHAVIANETAIKMAGIDVQQNNNEIIKVNGKSIGVFLENTADKIKAKVPEPNEAEMEQLLLQAAKFCYSVGLTAVTDAGLNKNEILRLHDLQQSGQLQLRIDAWLNPTDENLDYFVSKRSFKSSDMLHVGAIKMYADGALGSRGALLKMPYLDQPGHYGLPVTSLSELNRICELAYNNGFQVNTHAIGDSAVAMILHTYTKFLQPKNDKRWRIEHAQIVDNKDINIFGEYRIIPSIQTTHAISDMGWAEKRIGANRIKNAYAYQALLQQNGWLPNGTDFPIESIDPIKTFYAATARKNDKGLPENGFQTENALTRIQALKSMTQWAAKASFADTIRGTIAKGMKADFTVLDKNMLEIPENEILSTKVVCTVVNGVVVYKANR